MSVAVRIEAPAKVNLDLRVVGRRPDGFHELESTFALLELADGLLLMPGGSGLRVEGAWAGDVPLANANLAWRGLEAALGERPDLACLTLEKRIPVAAGLGGGSSDAAAAWRLGRAWAGRPDVATPDELEELAAIGADVPFFASGAAAARVTGIGERIEHVEPVELAVVLVHPPFPLRTAEVFAELRPADWGRAPNDLEAAAVRVRPELGDILDRVRRSRADARLTGSGPTIFIVDDDSERADAVAAAIGADGLRVTRTRTRTTPAQLERLTDPDEEDNGS